MSTGRTVVVTRRTGAAMAGRVEIVGRPDAPVPRWASEWCDQTGFELTRRPTLPEPALRPGDGGDRWSQVVADVADSTAAGAAVLVSRPSSSGSGSARVVAAVQDLPGDSTVLVDAAACAAALHGTLVLVHGVPVSFAERSIGLDAAVSRGLAVLDAATAFLETAFLAGEGTGVTTSTRLRRAYPHELVNEELEADLLVVGGPRRGQTGGLGLVALSAIQHAPCPVLVAPRAAAAG